MQIDTRSEQFVITNSANSTATSITFPVPTTTMPSGDGIIQVGQGGSTAPNSLMLVPYGAGTAAQTFLMNAYGWRRTTGLGGKIPIWVAVELATFTCTLATPPGLTDCDVNASQLFCGTITLGVGNANVSVEIVSPTGNVIAHIVLDAKGSQLVELRFSTNSSATSCNCLAAKV